MGIEDTKKFYDSDKKLYEVLSNEEFLSSFYAEELEKNYTLDEMQQIIDFISCWYEDKYTERDLEFIEKYGVPDFKSMRKNFEDRSVDNMFEMLPDKIAYFLVVDNSKTREKLLNLVVLKILYSPNTTPERGFERAKLFIAEFNSSVLDIRLNTHDVESSMNLKFDRLTVGDNMYLEDFIDLPIREAEKFIKANYTKALKGNNNLNTDYDSKGKVKVFVRRLFRNKK